MKKQRIVKDSAYMAMIGRRGGERTKQRKLAENPNYYSEIGTLGGEMIKQTRGSEFYSAIGKMNLGKKYKKHK